jgi:hypothetical protein
MRRTLRDELVGSGRSAIMSQRARVADLIGPEAPRRYAIPSVTPSDAGEVADTLETVAESMEEHPVQVSDSMGTTFDSAMAAVGLRALAAELRGALEKVATEERELDGALIERNRTVVSWRRSYRAVAGILSNVFLAAGEEELGERVRPTENRATGEDGPTPEDMLAVDPDYDPAVTPAPAVDDIVEPV